MQSAPDGIDLANRPPRPALSGPICRRSRLAGGGTGAGGQVGLRLGRRGGDRGLVWQCWAMWPSRSFHRINYAGIVFEAVDSSTSTPVSWDRGAPTSSDVVSGIGNEHPSGAGVSFHNNRRGPQNSWTV